MTLSSLDNPVWHALAGPHEQFAEVHGTARRYDRGVSVFSAVEGDDWSDLAACAEDGSVFLIRPELPDAPPGWTKQWDFGIDQMVADDLRAPKLDSLPTMRDLGADHIDAMLELTAIARPGPFVRGTPQLGRYIGVFEGERLIAMAGERMRLPGMTEVRAVCTHPDARGRGLAEALSHVIASGIIARDEQPFLHVAVDNYNAQRVYERLGFRRVQTLMIAVYDLQPA